MTDRELNSLLNPTKPECIRLVRRKKFDGQARRPVVPRKYRRNDVCPICLEEFSKKISPVVHCKYSCGQPMHGHCMRIVAKHQKDEINLICPLCRGEFSTRVELKRMMSVTGGIRLGTRSSSLPPLAKHDVKCTLCDDQVRGSLHKCLNCPNVLTCSVCVSSAKYSMHAEHGLVVKNISSRLAKPLCTTKQNIRSTRAAVFDYNFVYEFMYQCSVQHWSPSDKWKITTVKRDQHSGQMKRALPRLVRPEQKTLTAVADDKTLSIQCPICTDQGYSVVTLDCGHLVPSQEIERPSSPRPQPQGKAMTRSPRGRLARAPVTSSSFTSVFRPPPPEVIVHRVELASRGSTAGPMSTSGQHQRQQRSRSLVRRGTTSAYTKLTNRKKLGAETRSLEGGNKDPSPVDPRENGRILGSKVLPIMAFLLQKRAEEPTDDKFDPSDCIEENPQETPPPHQPTSTTPASSHRKAANKQRLAIQCVQLLPDSEPPLPNKPCLSRRQCHA